MGNLGPTDHVEDGRIYNLDRIKYQTDLNPLLSFIEKNLSV